MGRYVALLRGVNVGGHRKLPMKRAVALFEDHGCTDVTHYIQSGNIALSATAAAAKRVPALVAGSIADVEGFDVPVTLRSERELAAVARAHPFAGADVDPKMLHVAFLGTRPKPRAIVNIDPERSPGDLFEVRGREVFVYYARGAGKTKLTNDYLEKQLGVVSTMRNWRTVGRLMSMVTSREEHA